MATRTRVQVRGLQQLGEAMKALGDDIGLKISRAATNAGAQVVKKAAIVKAPEATGVLKANIVVKRVRPNSTPLTSEHLVTVLGQRSGRYANTRANRRKNRVGESSNASGDLFYARFLEFGTVKMSPKPFLRPAFEENKMTAVDAMKKRIKARIDKANKTAGKK